MAASGHRDITWLLMASGPSMCQADADMVQEWRDGDTRRTLAINNTWELAPWADVIYACDERWWDKYYEQASQTNAELWAYSEPACKKYSLNKARLTRTGGNSGYQAMRLAVTEFNASKILLLGYDMQANGKEHWHADHPKGWPNGGQYKTWAEHIRRLTVEFPDVQVLNCSRETALNINRTPLEDALSDRVAA